MQQIKPFWPQARAQQAREAIIFKALRRPGGAVLFCSLRPSFIQRLLFWRLGLTVQSSQAAPPSAGDLLAALGGDHPLHGETND